MTTLFFATDVHGSDICWKKFISAGKFYKADLIVLGGDMTGKAIVPIIHLGGENYKAVLLEQEFMLHGVPFPLPAVKSLARQAAGADTSGAVPLKVDPAIADVAVHPAGVVLYRTRRR